MEGLLLLMLSGLMGSITMQKFDEQANSKRKVDFKISSMKDLSEFALQVNKGNDFAGKLVKLSNNIITENITVNNFVPIGDCNNVFDGTFDGANFTISGIDIASSEKNYCVGLFGCTGENAVVKNVNIIKSNISKKGTNSDDVYLAAMVALNHGKIENCHSDSTILYTHGTSDQSCNVGGIAGTNNGEIINCSAYGSIAVSVDENKLICGGLAGKNNGNIYNSYNLCNIDVNAGLKTNYVHIGGLVGNNDTSNAIIQNCFNAGNITAIGGICEVGNIVSYADGMVEDSYCTEEPAIQSVNTEEVVIKNNIVLSNSVMKSTSFTGILNANRGKNNWWLKWVNVGSSDFPVLITTNEIIFKSTKNGVVRSDCSYAYHNQMVIFTVLPEINYNISKISVATTSGINMKVIKKYDKYYFLMANEKVVISASFIEK